MTSSKTKPLIVFKSIEVDIEGERQRIKRVYNKWQQKALLTLCDLFEAGEWRACLKHVNDKKAFPYNTQGHYDEKEHIGMEISDILCGMKYESFYTGEQILEHAKKRLIKEKKVLAIPLR